MPFYLSQQRRPLLATMALAMLLTACGGGGDKSSNSGNGNNGGSGNGGSGTPPTQVQPDGKSTLEAALPSGDVSKLNDNNTDLLKAIKAEFALRETEQSDLLNQVWGNESIVYAPGANSQLLVPQTTRESARTYPLVVGSGGDSLAMAGKVQGARVAAFGANVIGGDFPAMVAPTRRLLSWLLSGQQQDVSAAREITLLRYSNGEQTALKAWFKTQFPNWTISTCADDNQLASCTQNGQLLLVGSAGSSLNDSNAALLAFLNKSLAAGKPLLYQHTASWGDGGLPQIAGLLGQAPLPYAGNYFDKDSANWTNKDAMMAAQPGALKPMQSISRVVNHLAAADYTFNLGQCEDDRRCPTVPALGAEFFQGAEQLQSWIASVETAGKRPFDADAPKLLKYLVLLGDYYRNHVTYPMSKSSTPVNTFLQALFADHALASNRDIQPAMKLQGSSFPSLSGSAAETSVSRSFATRKVDFSTSAATYALPGKTFSVTRNDSSAAKVTVFINQLRSGAAHIFGDKYDRPQFLWGNEVPLEPGQTIKLSSPTGGIIYVRLQETDSPLNVALQFSGVGQQAAYTGPESAATFASAVRSTTIGWSEILTPALEIHSTTEKMRKTVTDYSDNVGKLLSDIDTYMYKDAYNLAAFNGRDLALPAGVASFCQGKGWDCASWDIHGLGGVQHFNADQANCGYLCSGQPIDSYAVFSPLGWGESHEIGHNLQRGRLKMYGSQSTEVSNNIFPIHKWLLYNRNNPTAKQYGRDIQQKATFDLLQAAQKQAAPADYVKTNMWFNDDLSGGRLQFYWQLPMDNSTLGDNGWDLYRLLYLHERLLSKASGSDASWSSERAKLGFSDAGYASRATVQSITAEDNMLVAVSFITGRDQRSFFDMWGIKYSATAAAQVAAYGYPASSKRFWVVPCEKNGLKAPLSAPVAVDGVSAWPVAGNCTQ
ncbi:Peptidase M60, enhancin and enhancin-like [Duganella sp. CF458]|uniref:ImpA family metalloprotease n=1 Tax=Duganella sp. CF458 TaxID=1884368 RepID=UPI0008ED1B21|nr:ImpA family metalloprotease [Duganella sp. CF458]SFF54799.1 Peptidase M60, enhancin and enhancin-like [Duganella sp. CF458]